MHSSPPARGKRRPSATQSWACSLKTSCAHSASRCSLLRTNNYMATATTTKDRYIETVGRRKTAIARVRLTPGTTRTVVTVNGMDIEKYFVTEPLRVTALE